MLIDSYNPTLPTTIQEPKQTSPQSSPPQPPAHSVDLVSRPRTLAIDPNPSGMLYAGA